MNHTTLFCKNYSTSDSCSTSVWFDLNKNKTNFGRSDNFETIHSLGSNLNLLNKLSYLFKTVKL